MKHIRNFCIIAHIDHGKSTLADRLLEYTQTIKVTEGQMLDDMDLEKERGITIKSHAIQMEYNYKGEKYVLNLIDTPGHVDFSYEVSRSIAACEGALLVVDASQGVQAQTISNLYMALENDLEIIPVMNKCDMDSAMPDEVEDEIVDLLGCKREEIIRASGKTGLGVEEILNAVIERIPHPEGDEEAPLQALIFDSVFNSFRGIIAYFKIENGVIRKGDKVKFFNTGKEYDADEIGVLKMDMVPRNELRTGDVGYIISGIKKKSKIVIGKASIRIPFFERLDKLNLRLIPIDVKTSNAVPTADYININVDATVNIKVSNDADKLRLAAENFLNKPTEYIAGVAREVLEGNVREIVGKMKLEEMVSDRQKFANLVKENAEPDLAAMGLDVVSFNVQNFTDSNGVIDDLGIDNISQIKKKAAIAASKESVSSPSASRIKRMTMQSSSVRNTVCFAVHLALRSTCFCLRANSLQAQSANLLL